jgi:hypothetical protein
MGMIVGHLLASVKYLCDTPSSGKATSENAPLIIAGLADSSRRRTVMKMRASELASAAILADGSLSIGFQSSTDIHTLELTRKAQEQLLPALLASEPANLQKFFPAADVQANQLSEGVLLTFPIKDRVTVRILVSEPARQKLLAQLTALGAMVL